MVLIMDVPVRVLHRLVLIARARGLR
jgi:hypothetical protein